MKSAVLFLTIFAIAMLANCSNNEQSKTETKSLSDSQQTAPEPAATVVEVSDQADSITIDVNDEGKQITITDDDSVRSITCDNDRITIAGDRNEFTVRGVCLDIMIPGSNNKVKVKGVVRVHFPGDGNTVTYEKLVNGKRPSVNDLGNNNVVRRVKKTSGDVTVTADADDDGSATVTTDGNRITITGTDETGQKGKVTVKRDGSRITARDSGGQSADTTIDEKGVTVTGRDKTGQRGTVRTTRDGKKTTVYDPQSGKKVTITSDGKIKVQ